MLWCLETHRRRSSPWLYLPFVYLLAALILIALAVLSPQSDGRRAARNLPGYW